MQKNSTVQLNSGLSVEDNNNSLQLRINPKSLESKQYYLELSNILAENHLKLTRFVRKHFIGADIVDDLVQQTCLEAFKNWDNFRGESRPETWLFGIAFNLVRNARVNHYRTQQTFEPLEDSHYDSIPDSAEEPVDVILQQEKMSLLESTINDLPKKMQAVVSLVFLEGKSYQEASDELGLPIGTIRSRLSRARDLMKEKLMH